MLKPIPTNKNYVHIQNKNEIFKKFNLKSKNDNSKALNFNSLILKTSDKKDHANKECDLVNFVNRKQIIEKNQNIKLQTLFNSKNPFKMPKFRYLSFSQCKISGNIAEEKIILSKVNILKCNDKKKIQLNSHRTSFNTK